MTGPGGQHAKDRGPCAVRCAAGMLLPVLPALLAALALTGPAAAACSDNAPAIDGITVTCDTTAPNPDPDGVEGQPGVADVTVNVLPGAGIDRANAGEDGVLAQGSGWTVNNEDTGTITGARNGIFSFNGGGPVTIDNAGAIVGNDGHGVSVGAGGMVTNRAGGTIFGTSSGIFTPNDGGPVGIDNAGEITGDFAGLLINEGGTVTNRAGGTISGEVGISADSGFDPDKPPLVVINAGEISGAGAIGSWGARLNDGSEVLNQAGGVIRGQDGALILGTPQDPATLVNEEGGLIETEDSILNGFGLPAITMGGGTVTNSGTIRSLGDAGGVSVGGGGTVTNEATGLIAVKDPNGQPAVRLSGAGATITNRGMVEGAVRLDDGGTATNATGGVIDGRVIVGALVGAGATGTVVNRGDIKGGVSMAVAGGTVTNETGATIERTAPFLNTAGVLLSPLGASLSNQAGATVTGSNHGVFSAATQRDPGTVNVVNAGAIAGEDGHGIFLRAGGTVTNRAGGIVDGSDHGVWIEGGEGTVANGAGATITGEGGTAIRFAGAFASTFENHGTVNGDVFLGAGDDTAILHNGSSINSLLDGGTGDDVIELASVQGLASTLDLDTTDVRGFETGRKTGNGAWTLKGASNTFDPGLSVLGGLLFANAETPGLAVDVHEGAFLLGDGTIGALTARSGHVSPGNSIGTLNVAGDLVFGPGAAYAVEIEPGGTSDRIAATGAATLDGGDVGVTAMPPQTAYEDGQTFTILTADTVTGTFDGVSDNSAFLEPSLLYGPDFVALSLAVSAAFPEVAETFNQRQASMGLMDLDQTAGSDGLAVFNELLMLDAEEARAAFDRASGEIHASSRHVLANSFDLFTRTIRRQGQAGLALSRPRGASVPLGYARPGVAIEPAAPAGARGAWAGPLGGAGSVEADGNAGALDWWTAGLAGGYEGRFDTGAGTMLGGIALGYLKSRGMVDARGSQMEADGIHVGAYGAWAEGPWSVSGALAYAANRIGTERRIVLGGIDRTAEADYWWQRAGFSGEAAYTLPLGNGLTFSPLATLDASWSRHGGARETGAGALNLTVPAEHHGRFDTGLGAAIAYRAEAAGGVFVGEGRVVWEHAFADVVPEQGLSFAASPTGFAVRGPEAGHDRLRVGFGVGFKPTGRLTVSANYDGVFSGHSQSHSANVGLKLSF